MEPDLDTPHLDDDGLLRYRGRWVVIPDLQLPVVALLLERRGRLVRYDEIVAVYSAAGGSSTRAPRILVARLRPRLAALGLRLHSVRARGVLLELAGR